MKLNSKQLRDLGSDESVSESLKKTKKLNDIYIILDDVLDTYNIGSVFRLAEAVGAKKVILCAGSETPPNHRIKKASINTTEWVNWSYASTAVEALKQLKTENRELKTVAIEQ